MKFYSPLRYPGGKGKISDYFKKIIARNFLYDCTYIEPYAGGASAALTLLMDEYVSRITINDLDRSIYAFWHSVLNKTDELCNMIQQTPVTVKVWRKQKEVQRQKDSCNLLELGFSTFFLNRTNRSGILNAGCIGGYNQTGKWKINARYNKKDLIGRIRRIALYKDRIDLYNLDAINLIDQIKIRESRKYLFYLDPPYYNKGEQLYLNFYDAEDHKKIACKVHKMPNSNWIITYDNVTPIRKLYPDFKRKIFNLNYSAGHASKGQEVMIFSKSLNIVHCPVV